MSHKVSVQPSGESFQVEEGETVLQAALRAGLAFPYSCQDGACGTCKNKILDGKISYPDNERPEALSENEDKQGLALFCQAHALTDLTVHVEEVSAIKGIQIKTLPCRVARKEQLAHDVMALFLTLPKNERLTFLAGQYIDIIMRDGRRRSFSLANAPHDNELLELHIRHVPSGAFSDFVFNALKEKSILRFKGPLGTFFMRDDSDRPMIMMAGGTGFAPIKGLIEHAIHIGDKRPIRLYWGVRALRDLYMPSLPEQWKQSHPDFEFVPVLSDPQPEDIWKGRTGFVTDAIMDDFEDLSQWDIYACGPPQMIDSGKKMFMTKGARDNRIYYDSFEYAKK